MALVRYCEARGDCQVVVKPHPNFTEADYYPISQRDYSPALRFYETADVRDLLAVSEICITDMSTVGLEAVIMGKPLLVVNLTGAPYVANPYDAQGVALKAECLDDIPLCLDALLDDAEVRNRLLGCRSHLMEAYNHGDDGAAAERIADLASASDKI